MDLAEGATCEPAGLTYDLQILHDGDGDSGGTVTSGAASSRGRPWPSEGAPWGALMWVVPSLYCVAVLCVAGFGMI